MLNGRTDKGSGEDQGFSTALAHGIDPINAVGAGRIGLSLNFRMTVGGNKRLLVRVEARRNVSGSEGKFGRGSAARAILPCMALACTELDDLIGGVNPGYTLFDLADRLRIGGWLVPAYTLVR